MKGKAGSCIFVILLVLCTCRSTSYAYYERDDISLEQASIDPKYWSQGSIPYGEGITLGTSDKTIAKAGCGYYALSFALVKMGLMDPSKDNPVELIKWANEDKRNRILSGDWHINPNALSERYPGVKVEADEMWKCTEPQGKSGEELKAWAKEKWDEGYYVILCMGRADDGAHYITVDGFKKDGSMVIADSAYTPTSEPKLFEQPNGYGAYGAYSSSSNKCQYAILLKYEEVKPSSSISIYDVYF